MKILAVDTSCDESCVAIVDTETNRLLADVVHSHIDAMAAYGGVVPEIASREHLVGLPLAIDQAIKKSGLSLAEIDWFAVTNRPGLVGALLVGVSYIKALAFAMNKPFSTLNHIEAHLFSPLLATLEGETVPAFPWVALVVSGGHTEMFLVEDFLKYRWLGGTRDDAAGEAFDKIGKLLKLSYPAGPQLDRWVKEKASEADRSAIAFPRAQVSGYEFSFSGLKTAVNEYILKRSPLDEATRVTIAASAQEAIVDALASQLEKATTELGVSQVVITGGVACNSRLRAKIPTAYFPRPRHCTDNAAMVAVLATLYARADRLEPACGSASVEPSLEFC